MKKYAFITADKDILGGKPIIQGTRISVDMILEWLASGTTIDEIAVAYPQLKIAAIKEALLYAMAALKGRNIIT